MFDVSTRFYHCDADYVTQIEDYEPRQSIVITPSKMQKYYEEVKLANEKYPWSSKLPLSTCRST